MIIRHTILPFLLSCFLSTVECPAPTVIQTSYSPRKDKYIFGDRVRVNYCKGNLAFEGSRRLECLKTGKWSDSAECKPCKFILLTDIYNFWS